MKKKKDSLWDGLDAGMRKLLRTQNYQAGSLSDRLVQGRVEARELAGLDRKSRGSSWIPGVEVFQRTVYPQRHRGIFGELARRDDGLLAEIGLWPAQWATARMFASSAKGFHIHPPFVPDGRKAEDWFEELFIKKPGNYSARPYDREQWDVMFFVQGVVEMFLREGRAGLPKRTMRFFIDGDNHRGANNVGVVVPAGVAHAIRTESSEDVIMVYGTTTKFQPEFEGRIAHEVETAELPPGWNKFLGEK